ncbi:MULTISPECIES: gluconokinase [unclassified Agrococcus]|uniref:gluconokinase n=1 Tax=unclassified Agrococcus TaxID=2615065 RepID=UPI00361237FF
MPVTYPPMIMMGAQGTGKSTIGAALAARLNVAFIDGDDLHPAANKQRMASGTPLTDEDRVPWLRLIGERIAQERDAGRIVIVACSALKRWYRELLRSHVPDLLFVHLVGDKAILQQRLAGRDHEYMPTTLLDSQLETLEPLAAWEEGVEVDIHRTPEQIVDELQRLLQRRARSA